MLGRMRARDPGQPLWRILFYRFCFMVTWVFVTILYRHRVLHAERVPDSGPLLVISNHQSHFDPPIVGISLWSRHIVPIARQGLFRVPLLGWLIRMLNSIPINEKEGDAVALRKAVKELGAGRCVLIFPEGSRSPDGQMHEFKRGAWLMLSRAKCTVLPVAVEGTFDAWPRGRNMPLLWGPRTAVSIGEPISFDRLHAMGPDAGLRLLAETVEGLRAEAIAMMQARRSPRP